MSWREDLITRLREHAGLTVVFGARIAWFEAARGWERTYPQLVLQEIAPGRAYTHDGPDPLEEPRVQCDIYAAPGGTIVAGEAALIAALEASGSAGDTQFHEGFLESRGSAEPEDLADQARVLRLTLDFTIPHESN